MKILPPHKISTEIIDVIYEAKEYLILVSPYVNLSNWDRLAAELKNAIKRGVKINFFVRDEPNNFKSWEQLSEIGIKAKLVQNLHAKFYFNENSGIISSMNLLSYSNSNSIEIACKIDDKAEIEELKKFVKDFIKVNESKEIPSDEDLYLAKEKFTIILQDFIGNNLNSRATIFFKDGSFQINTLSNQFFLYVDKVKNLIEISAIVSGSQSDFYEKEHTKYFKSDILEYSLNKANGNYHNTIVAVSKVRLSTHYLDNLQINEKKLLVSEITGFIDDVYQLKQDTPYK